MTNAKKSDIIILIILKIKGRIQRKMARLEYYYFNQSRLMQNFEAYAKLGIVCYPLKTNSSKELIAFLKPVLKEKGGFFLVSTPWHYQSLLNIGVLPSEIALINVLCDDEFIKKLYKEGVRAFSFDNLLSLKKFLEYADDRQCKISLKLNISNAFKKHSHLGLEKADFIAGCKLIKDRFDEVGINFYLPHSIKYKNNILEKMLNYIIKNFQSLGITFANIAGLKEASAISPNVISQFKSQLSLKQVYLEPGQYLLENVFDLCTNIIRFKEGKRKELIIQRGIYSGMLDCLLYKKQFGLYFIAGNRKIYLKKKAGHRLVSLYLFGGSGNSDDFLGRYYLTKEEMELLKTQSRIYLHNIGSYFEEFVIPSLCEFNPNVVNI